MVDFIVVNAIHRVTTHLILTMLLGLVGAWLGGVLGRVLGLYNEGHPAGFFMAVVGALVLLFLYHLAVGSSGRASIDRAPAEVQVARTIALRSLSLLC